MGNVYADWGGGVLGCQDVGIAGLGRCGVGVEGLKGKCGCRGVGMQGCREGVAARALLRQGFGGRLMVGLAMLASLAGNKEW